MAMHPHDHALDAAFAALADPTRRAMLAHLARGEADVSELMAPFGLSQPTISKHLKVLEEAGLVVVGRDAQRRPRSLVLTPLREIDHWLEPYRRLWEKRFERLDAYLKEQKTKATPAKQPKRRPRTK